MRGQLTPVVTSAVISWPVTTTRVFPKPMTGLVVTAAPTPCFHTRVPEVQSTA